MTDEQINQRIAEACGWETECTVCNNVDCPVDPLPNYCADLNATQDTVINKLVAQLKTQLHPHDVVYVQTAVGEVLHTVNRNGQLIPVDWHKETLSELEKLRAEIKEVYAANERIAAERDRARVLASSSIRELTATAANLIDENKLLHARIVELEAEKDDWPEE